MTPTLGFHSMVFLRGAGLGESLVARAIAMAMSRHIGLNIVLNSQQYVGLSTLQRKSLSCIGIFRVHARKLDGVISELAGKNNASADDLYQAFRIATAKAHGFL